MNEPTIAAPLAPFEPGRGRKTEPLTLLGAIRRFGELCGAEHGSPQEADEYDRQAMTLLSAIEGVLSGQRAELDRLRTNLARDRVELVAKRNDLLNIRGALSPSGYAPRVPMELGATVAPAIEWLLNDRDRLAAELEQAKADAVRIDTGAAAVIRKLGQIHERTELERDAARAALKAIAEHVGLMESEIADHQSYDYNVNDIDEVAANAHQQGCYAEHEKITRELLELLDNDAVRLAAGVTCQAGQPWSCGDAHTAGHCVRTVATPAAAPQADEPTIPGNPYPSGDPRGWVKFQNCRTDMCAAQRQHTPNCPASKAGGAGDGEQDACTRCGGLDGTHVHRDCPNARRDALKAEHDAWMAKYAVKGDGEQDTATTPQRQCDQLLPHGWCRLVMHHQSPCNHKLYPSPIGECWKCTDAPMYPLDEKVQKHVVAHRQVDAARACVPGAPDDRACDCHDGAPASVQGAADGEAQLPGTWEQADLAGGQTDAAPVPADRAGEVAA